MEDKDENLPEDGAEYSPKSDFSKAEVVKAQVSKCNEIRSQEMREGYFNFDKLGNKILVPDSRKAWVSSVKALRQLLEPEVRRDKNFQEKEKKIKEKEKQAFDTWKIYSYKEENGVLTINKKQNPKIPYLDQAYPIFVMHDKAGQPTKKVLKWFKGMFNDNFHNYWNDLVEIYDEYFAELNVLIDNCNYFKQQTSY